MSSYLWYTRTILKIRGNDWVKWSDNYIVFRRLWNCKAMFLFRYLNMVHSILKTEIRYSERESFLGLLSVENWIGERIIDWSKVRGFCVYGRMDRIPRTCYSWLPNDLFMDVDLFFTIENFYSHIVYEWEMYIRILFHHFRYPAKSIQIYVHSIIF